MASPDQHIIMLGFEQRMTSVNRGPEAAFDTAALWRVAGPFGHCVAHSRFMLSHLRCLKRKQPPADLAATGGFEELRPLLKGPHNIHHVAVAGARHLSRQAFAAACATGVQDFPAVLGGHACAETMTTGAHQTAGLKCTFHKIRPRRARFLF